jgi:hypothetical protein
LNNNPSAYLDKIQTWLFEEHKIITCISTINHMLRNKMNISLKKNNWVNPNQSDLKLGEYLNVVGTMHAEFMVFAGEQCST